MAAAFSGKDPTKVDRSGAYMARAIAKNIVWCDYAKQCQVAISYAIGKADPVAVEIDTFGTRDRLMTYSEKRYLRCLTCVQRRSSKH